MISTSRWEARGDVVGTKVIPLVVVGVKADVAFAAAAIAGN
jgi:hypothetical protein